MKNNKIYNFMASSDLWLKENRIYRTEDISKAPYYEDLMFEIKSDADIEPLIAAKEAKFKSDDLKFNMQQFAAEKESILKKTDRHEFKLKKLENFKQHIEIIEKELKSIYGALNKKKKNSLIGIFSSYTQNGIFVQSDVVKFMTQKDGFFSSLFENKKNEQLKRKISDFMKYCKENKIYEEFQTDPNGKTKEVFEHLMQGKPVNLLICFSEINLQIERLSNEIGMANTEIANKEYAIKLANDSYEMDNFVIINLENEIIRNYANDIKNKLFPKPEIKIEEPVIKDYQEDIVVKNNDEISPKSIDKIKSFLGNVKAPDLKNIQNKAKEKLSSIKSCFKKKK